MTKLVTLTIDGMQVSVPEGTLVVDAAKKIGIDIPVFCYHPKMEPVGMCRMCLVEIGRPVIDRSTGQPVLEDDGSPKIQFSPNLETACTTPVCAGMVVLGATEKARAGREDIIEFLLTSHPLDCPICDKGGECPLQNLTIKYGSGQSRYLYDEKKHFVKHVSLGELIFLDRERCIQCGRCVRFQSEIVDDPVIGFFHRGRALEIVTYSDPGFDSYFSGNTTDICPVGALTTADFRFGARPWELNKAASICNHCPVGCNLTMNVRREAASGGDWVVKRVMPRQNESVNEIWVCDKGRFGYHFAASSSNDQTSFERLSQPLVRKNAGSDHPGELVPASWDEALSVVSERFAEAGDGLLALAGGRLANEDLFNLKQLTTTLGGEAVLYTHMAGGELTTQLGIQPGSDIGAMGQGDAILVVACDLVEEAPIWWLRVKQAAERGAQLIVLNSRSTKLDQAAAFVLRYPFGAETSAVLAMLNALSEKRLRLPEVVQMLERDPTLQAAAEVFSGANNALIMYGSDCIGLTESQALAQACANLLDATGHVGRPNNGLLGVWPRANDQGAWELGFQTHTKLGDALGAAAALYIVAADPAGDDPTYLGQSGFGGKAFVVVQDLYLTQTARLADVVLPAQSWIERDGSFTSGERRAQRFYPVIPPRTAPASRAESPSTNKAPLLIAGDEVLESPLPDFAITAMITLRIDSEAQITASSAARVFNQMAETVPAFSDQTYLKLAQVHEQWPIVGRDDLYYGGTSYENTGGLGMQLALNTSDTPSTTRLAGTTVEFIRMPKLGQIAFPITRLYDQGKTLMPSQLLHERIGEPYIVLNVNDAEMLRIQDGDVVHMTVANREPDSPDRVTAGQTVVVQARLDQELPERVVLVPRSFGIPIDKPTPVEIRRTE